MTSRLPLSASFISLHSRYRALRKKFLSRQLALELRNPLTFQADLDHLAAFRLLFHAEVEDYLELKATDSIRAIKADIQRNHRVVERLDWFALAARFDKTLPLTCPHDLNAFLPIASQILDAGLAFVAQNNGIKAPSFVVLSLLCGKMTWSLDDALAASLNAYGSDRGNVAHRSVTRVRSINAPSAEDSTAASLLRDLKRYFYNR